MDFAVARTDRAASRLVRSPPMRSPGSVVTPDSWINGFSKEFAKEMAAPRLDGLTWPTEFGGWGRPPVDRLIIGEELIAAGARSRRCGSPTARWARR
ncbi:MAG: acyl-CoA dehydrogenase family protein [Ilumatobacteraceae bacterium]